MALWSASSRPKSAEVIQEMCQGQLTTPCATRWNSLHDSIWRSVVCCLNWRHWISRVSKTHGAWLSWRESQNTKPYSSGSWQTAEVEVMLWCRFVANSVQDQQPASKSAVCEFASLHTSAECCQCRFSTTVRTIMLHYFMTYLDFLYFTIMFGVR